jgi:LysM repeat protein
MPENTPQSTKVCPTCGTRLAENASRCLVCGTELTTAIETKKPAEVQAARMPEITLSLPMALGLLTLFLMAGAALVFFAMRLTGTTPAGASDVTATITATPTLSPTATIAFTQTPVPTSTTQPPFDYTIGQGDTCLGLAATFNVSFQSIILENNLSANCILSVGQKIKIPYPTPTQPPAATSTLEAGQATLQACDKVIYTVQDGDTLSIIAANYAVPQDAIKSYNGLSTDTVFLGMNLIVPLCERAATPGPSPTATIPPPYPAANLLLPADGSSFTLANDAITLQWASIGTLRENEAYQVIVEDVTDGTRRIVQYVTDTKFIVPSSFRPRDNSPHVIRWSVTTVRQSGTDEQGQPVWVPAGAQSDKRVFSWQGVAPQETPEP